MTALPPPAPDTCLLYLVRHGATANNVAKPARLQGRRTDPGLSEEGRTQAAAAASLLSDRPLRMVYASPLLRARQTADTIAAAHGLSTTIVDALIEVDVGDWEGRDWVEIERSDPEAYRRFMEDPASNSYTGGENFRQVADRVLPAVDALLQQNLGHAIAIVGHNVVNRVCLAEWMRLPISLARTILQHNCGINVVRRRNNADQVITANAVFHLGRF